MARCTLLCPLAGRCWHRECVLTDGWACVQSYRLLTDACAAGGF